jgi:hypothetical protein
MSSTSIFVSLWKDGLQHVRNTYHNHKPERSEPDWSGEQLSSSTSDNAPSEARKRGSGGGSPRKYHDLKADPSDLDVRLEERAEGPTTSAKNRGTDCFRITNFFLFFSVVCKTHN